MNTITFLGLLLCVLSLYWAVRKGLLDKDTIQIWANIAGIVALVAASLVFIVPAPISPDNVNNLPSSSQNSEAEFAAINSTIISGIVIFGVAIWILLRLRKNSPKIAISGIFPLGYKVSAPGALLTFVSFFMTWGLHSCNRDISQASEVSGFALIKIPFYNQEEINYFEQIFNPFFLLLIVLMLSGVLVLTLLLIVWKDKTISRRLDGTFVLGLGLFSISIMIWILSVFMDLDEIFPFLLGMNVNDSGILVSQPGLYGIIAGNLAMAIGGYITRKALEKH